MDLNIHATIKRITLINMLGSIPHQKFCFYHLPTRGRAGIKLGDAWYVSNVSIIFIVPCYYIFCFGCLMGFNMLFYIIFGTILLTEGLVPVSVFLPILEFCRKGIPNRVQMEWHLRDDLSWTESKPEDLEMKSERQQGSHEARGHAPHPRGPLVAPLT